ncbi:MAG TPA: alkaline phosphatase family protein, partial [Chthonomonadaceae bacterium]|nr:alkaline phosphatase family protein [Chthonomonadaceae bacterium]
APLHPAIKHVIYIIKENRTYDQVLGDLPQGNGDPSLVLFGRDVTPNLHALAERFVLLDNFYDCAEVSADGWNWSTSGMVSEYAARNVHFNYSGRGRNYDFEGENNGTPVDLIGLPDVNRAPGGYIWDAVAKKGLSYRGYGFFTAFADSKDANGKMIAKTNEPNRKALVGHTDVDYLKFDMDYADSDAWKLHNCPETVKKPTYGQYGAPSRFAEWKREFDGFIKNGSLPAFSMVRLPRDHTSATRPGSASPRAMVADNDYAVGQLVEAVSSSPYWKDTAIFILEDDAQDGYDHVDAHRSICFVISPYIRRGMVDHHFYNTDSVLHSMEWLLGVPAMNQYDAGAPLLVAFGAGAENNEPYKAILPERQIVAEVNGETAYRAKDSQNLDFSCADRISCGIMNDILWHSVKGVERSAPIIHRNIKRPVASNDVENR